MRKSMRTREKNCQEQDHNVNETSPFAQSNLYVE